jgi:type IV pilus assembly protein PilV
MHYDYAKHDMTHPDPAMFRRTRESRSARERGFSLLEVLIALLVLSVGLLGIAGLQTLSLQFNHQSYERTQATVLISEMFEKISTNPEAARTGTFDNIADSATSASYTGYGTCPTACSVAELATYDIFRWKRAIEDPRILAQGTGEILVVPDPADPASRVYDITVRWVENNQPMRQTMRARTLHR